MASAEGIFGVVESMPINNGYMDIPIKGDLDGSGQVGQGDLDVVLLGWGTVDPETGSVGQESLDCVLLNWGKTQSDLRPWSMTPEQVDPQATGGQSNDLRGDYNGTGLVGQGDLDLVLRNWGQEVPPIPDGWVNPLFGGHDGQISTNELDGVLLNWGNQVAPTDALAAVPEPTSLALVCLGGLGCIGVVRRSCARLSEGT